MKNVKIRKMLSTVISLSILCSTFAIPASAEVALDETNVIYDFEVDGFDTSSANIALDDTTFPERGTVIANKNSDTWSNYYFEAGIDKFGQTLTSGIVNLSYDLYIDANHVNGPVQYRTVAITSQGWERYGFMSYDVGSDTSAPSNGEWAMTSGYLTYQGTPSTENDEPTDESGKIATKAGKWIRIDSVYDIDNKVVAHYVDGEYLGSTLYTPNIAGFRIRFNHGGHSVGKSYFDNMKVTRSGQGTLNWEAEPEDDDSFLINLSEPVMLVKDMLTLKDMETLEDAVIESVEKVSATQYRVTVADGKANTEYKLETEFLTSITGATAKSNILYANTGVAKTVNSVLADDNFDGWTELKKGWSLACDNGNGLYAPEITKAEAVDDKVKVINAENRGNSPVLMTARRGIKLPENTKSYDIEFEVGYQQNEDLANNEAWGTVVFYNSTGGGMGLLHMDPTGVYLDSGYSSCAWENPIAKTNNDCTKMNKFRINFNETTKLITVYCNDVQVGTISPQAAPQKLWGNNITGIGFGSRVITDKALDSDDVVTMVDNVKITAYHEPSNFGVKQVRYGGTVSDISYESSSLGSDNFDSYTGVKNPGVYPSNLALDYQTVSGEVWQRSYHSVNTNWGYGSYVNQSNQMVIDVFQTNETPTLGVRRSLADEAITEGIIDLEFDAAFGGLPAAGGSNFALNIIGTEYTYPIFNTTISDVTLFNSQLTGDEYKIAAGVNDNNLATMEDYKISIDLDNEEVILTYGNTEYKADLDAELANAGIKTIEFAVENQVGYMQGADMGSLTAYIDNFEANLKTKKNIPEVVEGVEASKTLFATVSEVEIEFTDAVAQDTLTGITVVSENGDFAPVSVADISEDGKTVTLNVKLDADTLYTVEVPESVTSVNGAASRRAYAFEIGTDKNVKFYDADGNEIEDLASAKNAEFEIKTYAPAKDAGSVICITSIYAENGALKQVTPTPVTYNAGGMIEYKGDISVNDGEYAKIMLIENYTNLKPLLSTVYTIGK